MPTARPPGGLIALLHTALMTAALVWQVRRITHLNRRLDRLSRDVDDAVDIEHIIRRSRRVAQATDLRHMLARMEAATRAEAIIARADGPRFQLRGRPRRNGHLRPVK